MDYLNENTNPQPKRSRKKIFLLGLGALGLGMLTFFSIRFWKKHKEETASAPIPETKVNETKIKKPVSKAPNSTTKAKTAQSTKPNENKASTPPPPKAAPKPINASLLAKALHTAISKKDFTKAFLFLKPIKTTSDYSAVNKVFSQFITGGVRQTLVTALLNNFKDEKQKQALSKAFTAMGLKYNGKKWSLSGINDSTQIITTTDTKVWKDPRTTVSVPLNMVLGREVCKRGTFTLFENDSQYFLVESKAVKAYQA